MEAENIVYLDPTTIVADSNIRHSINVGPLDILMKDITAQGGVQEPVTVEPFEDGTYRLVKGFRRHAAVTKLNTQGAGLLLPAIVRNYGSEVDRLKAQIAENVVRESLSPIDTAIAMSALLAAGLSKVEVRETFAKATPKGSQPMSNALVNIYLNMLDLPKSIQNKIHDGRVGVKAAYELSKVPAEQQAEVLARAEAEAEKQAAQEEKDEARYLKAVQKEAKRTAKLKEDEEKAAKLDADIAAARKDTKEAEALHKTRAKELDTIEKSKGKATEFRKLPVEKQKEINEGVRAAVKSLDTASKASKDAANKLAKLLEAKNKLVEKAEEADEEEAPAEPAKGTAAKAKGKPAKVTDTQVKKAAKDTTGNGTVPLNLSEVKVAFKDISKAGTPRVASLGAILLKLLSGDVTTKEAIHDLGVVTGEVKNLKA